MQWRFLQPLRGKPNDAKINKLLRMIKPEGTTKDLKEK